MIPLLIARNTFREATRDRVLFAVVGLGLAILLFTQILSPLALGEGRRLTVDLGLTSITMLGLLVVVLVGTSLVAKEVERRTIYNLLSRPIARHEYLIGKWVGLTATLWVLCLALGTALCVLLAWRNCANHVPAVMQATYLAGLELSVVTSIAVLFSALSSPVLSAIYTLSLYLVGQWTYDLRVYAGHFPDGLGRVMGAIANLMPNLPLFNMRTLAAGAETTSAGHLGIASLYALVYVACALCLATAAFERRDFK